MRVAVTYAQPNRQLLLEFEVPEGTTAQQAVERSGILSKFPDINLAEQKLGIYAKLVENDQVLEEGDRVEIYRPAKGKPKKKERPAAKSVAEKPAQGAEAAAGDADKAAKIAAIKAKAAAAKAAKGEDAQPEAASADDKAAKIAAIKAKAAAAKKAKDAANKAEHA
ncbi:protein of unknown function UPF0125 [Magnetococcus marinus MC-1]|uniref:UPF0125 protein Mmc1_2099 n=1 Tax=Magnetococcus marinus (strain ATCC BAA-1437 / JCM 17883 / MC-1) TaxID=156889 RepID=A0L9F7_MAGMM|nr:RnfH family protein [Magnetococcus marinus]ABK44600.1 protein of unknown function UPF0125 [Magnetococcus marinus MC-1]